VIPGPQETHFLGHIGVVRVTIDAACDIRLLQDGGLHLVVVCGAAGRDFILEHIKGYNRFPKLTVSEQTCFPCSAHTDTPWVAITDQMYWKTLKKKYKITTHILADAVFLFQNARQKSKLGQDGLLQEQHAI